MAKSCDLTALGRKEAFYMKSLPVLYQDEHLIAMNNPSGLLVHRSAIDRHELIAGIIEKQLPLWTKNYIP
jgi:23S rRNA-/tRNA-specific pseudouridylate synthase